MKRFRVLLSETFRRQLLELEPKLAGRIKAHLRGLEDNPFRSRPRADIKKLTGSFDPELWRLRIGDIRAIYTVAENDVKVTQLVKRSQGYGWLE